MRVALLSALPPDPSCLGCDLAPICDALGRLVDLHVFTPTANPGRLHNVTSIRHLREFRGLAHGFDRAIGILTNTPSHRAILDDVVSHQTACIVHDDYLFETALLDEIAQAARPMITHSSPIATTPRSEHGPVHVPYPICRTWRPVQLLPDQRRAARSRLGFQDGEVSIVVLGPVRQHKAPIECIEAVEMLWRWGAAARLYFAGSCQELPDGGKSLAAHARSLEIGDLVQFADGYASERTYRDYLLGADLALNLRTHVPGAVSATLLDSVAAGLPTVTTVGLRETASVPTALTRAVPNHLSPVLIAEALADLSESARGPDWEPQRRAFCEARSVEAYARLLCETVAA